MARGVGGGGGGGSLYCRRLSKSSPKIPCKREKGGGIQWIAMVINYFFQVKSHECEILKYIYTQSLGSRCTCMLIHVDFNTQSKITVKLQPYNFFWSNLPESRGPVSFPYRPPLLPPFPYPIRIPSQLHQN